MGVGMPADLLLDEYGLHLQAAFRHVAYHVGSSLRLKNGWRDVDVRIMLPDEEWSALEVGTPGEEHVNMRWCAICTAWAVYGRHLTGLPIDFQLQQLTWANRDYSSAEDHPRSALGIVAARRHGELRWHH